MMDSKAQLINNEEKHSLALKKLWVAPMLVPLEDQNNINGTLGPGSDLGQPVPQSGS